MEVFTHESCEVSSILHEVESKGLKDCIMCRTCSASCPVAAVDGRFNPLKTIRMAVYGKQEEILAANWLWLCSSCYACQERCPQGIRITDIIIDLKNLAAINGYSPQGIKAQKDIITQQGRIYPIDEFDNKKRAKIGLPPLPTSCEWVDRILVARPSSGGH